MTINRIRSFLYRYPRFTVDCRMDFIREDSIVLGTCFDLSQSGLRGTFVQDVPQGAIGVVTLYLGERRVELQATVSSVREEETRMLFQFDSEKERVALRDILDDLAPPVRK